MRPTHAGVGIAASRHRELTTAASGLLCIEQTAAAALAALDTKAQDSPFTVQATIPVNKTVSGIEVVDLTVTDATNRTVQLTIRNRFLRWLTAYVQYLDASGNLLPFVSTNDNDRADAYWIGLALSGRGYAGTLRCERRRSCPRSDRAPN